MLNAFGHIWNDGDLSQAAMFLQKVETELIGHVPNGCHLCEGALPDAALGPAITTVVDRRCRTLLGRHVTPAAARLQDEENAADGPTIIYLGLLGLPLR